MFPYVIPDICNLWISPFFLLISLRTSTLFVFFRYLWLFQISFRLPLIFYCLFFLLRRFLLPPISILLA